MKKLRLNFRLFSRKPHSKAEGEKARGQTVPRRLKRWEKFKEKVQKIQWRALVHRVRWRLVAPCLILTALSGIFWACFVSVGHQFPSIYAAETWRGDNTLRYMQVASFLPADAGKTEEDIFSFRQTLDQKMVDNSLESEGEGKLYADAYSAFDKLTVSSERTSTELEAIGVGGEFFLFHPLELKSGSYFSEDDFMQDGVVLDETAAWKLFGGYDLTGLPVTIGSQSYVVLGVVSREDDRFTEKSMEDVGTIYLPFAQLQKQNENALITCYEVAMPNPVKQFALNLMKESFATEDAETLEITNRFSVARMWNIYRQFGQRSVQEFPLSYPYWENAQRMAEDYAALYLLAAVGLILFPLAMVVFYGSRLLHRTFTVKRKALKLYIETRVEQRRENRLEQKMAAKQKQKEGSEADGNTESASCEQSIR